MNLTNMPVIVDQNGGNKWYQGEQRPATHVGNPRTQRDALRTRQERTVAATSRSIKMFNAGIITEEELEEAIGRNAATVEMDPHELRELAQGYLDFEEQNSNGIEKE